MRLRITMRAAHNMFFVLDGHNHLALRLLESSELRSKVFFIICTFLTLLIAALVVINTVILAVKDTSAHVWWTVQNTNQRTFRFELDVRIPAYGRQVGASMVATSLGVMSFSIASTILYFESNRVATDKITGANIQISLVTTTLGVLIEVMIGVALLSWHRHVLLRFTGCNGPTVTCPNGPQDFKRELAMRQGCIDADTLIGATASKPNVSLAEQVFESEPFKDNTCNPDQAKAVRQRNVILSQVYYKTRRLDAGSMESTAGQIAALNTTVLIACIISVIFRYGLGDTLSEQIVGAIVTTLYISAGLGVLQLWNVGTACLYLIILKNTVLREQALMYSDIHNANVLEEYKNCTDNLNIEWNTGLPISRLLISCRKSSSTRPSTAVVPLGTWHTDDIFQMYSQTAIQ